MKNSKEVDTLEDLYRKELADLLDLERQQTQFLSSCADGTKDAGLSDAIRAHAEVTAQQVARLEALVPSKADVPPFTPAAEIIARGVELHRDPDSEPEVIDAAMITTLQSVKHLEIAKYGSAKSYGEDLGHVEEAQQLTQSLEEDALFDRELSRIAERYINFRAADQ